jgi:hypothetical protein
MPPPRGPIQLNIESLFLLINNLSTALDQLKALVTKLSLPPAVANVATPVTISAAGVKFYDRTFTDPTKNTVALGSINTKVYGSTSVLLSLVCHQSGYEFSGTLRYTGTKNNTGGAWQRLEWEKWDDPFSDTVPSFFYEVMSDTSATNFRVRVMR